MWIDLLRTQVKARGLGAVSRQLGYAKSGISMVLSGTYGADTRWMQDAVLKAFGTVSCPYEGTFLAAEACRSWRERDVPTSSAEDLRHWSACRRCPHNPHAEGTL